MTLPDYSRFLDSPTAHAWKKIGPRRRAGVMTPLFSVWSERSVGVGEIPDLEELADWCLGCGMSVIQLLPMNDVGDRFCPYDAESSFALEPMHLSLGALRDVSVKKFAGELSALRARYPFGDLRFDPGIKEEKMTLLFKIFEGLPKKRSGDFEAYKNENRHWLGPYALFKVLKRKMKGLSWEAWPEPIRSREKDAILRLERENAQEIEFHAWVQWQLFFQLKETASRLRKKKVLLLGDLPFLVARDSADVWACPEYFKLGLSSGAPPDLYFADGQEWGMPPYHWAAMAASGYDYMKDKMRYAAHFYDLFRMDHFVGIFRVWTFPKDGSADRKSRGAFDPPEETLWDPQARAILNAILDGNPMLPCAEDLGTVPDQAKRILKEYAIPGMEVQRWVRDWEGSLDFLAPEEYRACAVATISTHDMSSFENWWKFETTPDDRVRFWKWLGFQGEPDPEPTRRILESALDKASQSASIFSIQSIQDLLGLDAVFGAADGNKRFNQPGIMNEENWRLRVPISLKKMGKLPGCKTLKEMHGRTGRGE